MLTPPNTRSRIFILFSHWAAWIILHFVTFLPTFFNITKIVWGPFLFTHLVLVSFNFSLFYVVAFHIMPFMDAFKKKWFWMVIASLLLAIVFTYLKFRLEIYHTQRLLESNSMFNNYNRRPSNDSPGFFGYRFRNYFQFNILTNVSIVIVAFAYRLLLIWFQQEKIRSELQNQKLRAELSYLKLQVNPHFLFNALNNIFSLSVIENTKRTSSSILKLSDLMRYMLYEREDEEGKVTLEKEIQHINNYIDLEKLRHGDTTFVDFSIEGEIDNKKIAPLLLFPLIENAFKHGIVTDPARPLTIRLKIEGNKMCFLIDNFKNSYQKDKVGGIGVQNVKKRLDLIYGENYALHISDKKDRYIVNLILPL